MSGFDLLYLSVGSGHKMAAIAVGQAISRERPGASVAVFDPLINKFPGFIWLANLGLSVTARYGGQRYDRQWRSGDSKLIGLASNLAWLARGLSPGRGQVVVATHVFALRIALAHKARGQGAARVYGVATDFGLHGYWPLDGVDGYFVAHDDLAVDLAQRGFPPERIFASGIPLRLDFESQGEWTSARSGGPLRVAILAGGVSSGAYTVTRRWIAALLDALPLDPLDVRFTVVTGSRANLLTDLEEMAKQTRFELYPRGLVGDMAGMLHSHDLVLTKPGGVSLAEALACGLPVAAMRPSMGQEMANVRFLARHGLLEEAYTPEQAGEVITRAARDPDWLWDHRMKARRLGKPDASKNLAQLVLREAN